MAHDDTVIDASTAGGGEDIDPQETREWLDALRGVLEHDGSERARWLLERLAAEARLHDPRLAFSPTTAYVNTIPPGREADHPGDPDLERRLENVLRWNAAAMVVGANRRHDGLGGHIATYAAIATLFETGLHHFFRAPTDESRGDLVFFQGHASPGLYARSFLEGRLSEEDLLHFRREVGRTRGEPGLSSYPHPWLMPDYWCLPTVSMGLGPLMAIYQARFQRYLEARGLIEPSDRKVWAFLGDGEMDEPEATGALSIAAREGLDNLVFVVNCNLQRLDGPVRGNQKVIQELEGIFRGAGWNVIKVIWGRGWDPLLAADHDGALRRRMMEAVDGDWQAYAAKGGAYFREHFFGDALADRVSHLSDDELAETLQRGGHDPFKVHAAYRAAVDHTGGPTVILAKTVKGFGMGSAGEALNTAHQQKKMSDDQLLAFRDLLDVPLSDEQVADVAFHRPDEDAPEMVYLKERREALGGSFPRRVTEAPALDIPDLDVFSKLLDDSGGREISTTMAFVRFVNSLLRHGDVGRHVVPIVADEARTFGMEGMFKTLGIYNPAGQRYEPMDVTQLAAYTESEDGQVLQEGITEAGAFSSWAAAGTAHANHGLAMIPFFIFYSMFGFQRIGDLAWAAADMQARGFLIGATSGRTTLNGEGLQHEDGQSHVQASVVPTCIAYDPTWAYEVTVILHEGLRRMYGEGENVFFYVTTLNENYEHPAMPEGAREGILKGMHRIRRSSKRKNRVRLLGSGAILREVLAAAELLEEEHGVAADVWSVTSFTELARDGHACDRKALLHPQEEAPTPWVTACLEDDDGPVVAATDYVRSYADQIRAWVPGRYRVLGTDGFGRSDTREALRDFFEVDRHWVALAALESLAREGALDAATVAEARDAWGIDPDRPAPWTV